MHRIFTLNIYVIEREIVLFIELISFVILVFNYFQGYLLLKWNEKHTKSAESHQRSLPRKRAQRLKK